MDLGNKQLISVCSFSLEIPGVTDEREGEPFTAIDGLSKYVAQSQNYFYGGEQHSGYLPSKFATKNLTLKRPITTGHSNIFEWIQTSLNTFEFEPKDMILYILDSNRNILAKWDIISAIPISFDISTVELNSADNSIYETFIFNYKDLTMLTNQS